MRLDRRTKLSKAQLRDAHLRQRRIWLNARDRTIDDWKDVHGMDVWLADETFRQVEEDEQAIVERVRRSGSISIEDVGESFGSGNGYRGNGPVVHPGGHGHSKLLRGA